MKVPEWAAAIRPERRMVIAATVLGAAGAVFQGAVEDLTVYRAIRDGFVLAFFAMGFMGIAHGLWKGRQMKQFGMGEGGPNAELEQDVAATAGGAVATANQLNKRMTDQFEDFNKRLLDLEREVFKVSEEQDEPRE